MGALDGKVAIVTGAGKGIGAAIAVTLAEAGADVAITARTKDDLDGVAEQIGATGRRAFVYPSDVMKFEELSAFVDATVGELGGLDIVVNNAGVGRGPMDPNVPSSERGAAPGALGIDAMSAARWDEYLSL